MLIFEHILDQNTAKLGIGVTRQYYEIAEEEMKGIISWHPYGGSWYVVPEKTAWRPRLTEDHWRVLSELNFSSRDQHHKLRRRLEAPWLSPHGMWVVDALPLLSFQHYRRSKHE